MPNSSGRPARATSSTSSSSSSSTIRASTGCIPSISMCVLRFEVAAELPLPSHLNYRAPTKVDQFPAGIVDGGSRLAAKLKSDNGRPTPVTGVMLSSDSSTQTSDYECAKSTYDYRQPPAARATIDRDEALAGGRPRMSTQQQRRSRRPPDHGAGSTKATSAVGERTDDADAGPAHVSQITQDVEEPFELVVNKHRGRRKIHDIVIETHHVETQTGALAQSTLDSAPKQTLNFYSGNPFVEVTKGILHLFKENQMTSLTEKVIRSEMLCILAVPAAMTSHDLLQFMAPCGPNVGHIRIIRDATPNQYMALIKFRSQAAADEFYVAFNSKRFNSIEPHVCHLVYVASVETTKEFQDGCCLPLEGHTELPTCPVCLERMDESVDGILTILCNHSFHGGCLAKWGDTSCPVCRYCQTPEVAADNRCTECCVQESLWICLICGHVGCGRYVEGHAYKHFVETQHTYAMQLGNNRVWDYAGDNYVHRLIQNKADGKLVELNDESYPASVEQEEKLDSMQLEYTYLLTSQLESQRLYFEEKVLRIEQECHRQVDDLVERMKRMADECSEMKRRMDPSGREKAKVQQLTSKLQKAQLELAEERQMNACLQENQQEWQTRVKSLERELERTRIDNEVVTTDLKEQLRDVMFYLEAEQTLRNASDVTADEVAGGRIVVGPAVESGGPSTSSKGAGGAHRRKKKP